MPPLILPRLLANVSGERQHEDQHFGDRLVEFGRNLVAQFDMRQRAGEDFVFLDRNAIGLRDLDNLLAKRSPALGNDTRRAGVIIVQRDRKLALLLACPLMTRDPGNVRRVRAGCTGAPSRTTISPGCNSARANAWLSRDTPARN